MEVRVLVVSTSLVLTSESEEARAEVSELPRKSDSMKDGKSI